MKLSSSVLLPSSPLRCLHHLPCHHRPFPIVVRQPNLRAILVRCCRRPLPLFSAIAIIICHRHHCLSPTFCHLLPPSLIATSSLHQPSFQILVSHCRRHRRFFSAISPPLVPHCHASCHCHRRLSMAEPHPHHHWLLSAIATDSPLQSALIISFPNRSLLVAVDLHSSSLLL